jgi:hypothetical protein
MMNLESILQEWSSDCEINANLENASKDTPKLHAKYLNYYSVAKLQLKRVENSQKVLLKDKFLYYNGKLSKEEIDAKNWAYDPFNGLKIMKGDMSYYYESDVDIQRSEEKVVYYKTMVETLKEIVDTLRWRHTTIKNMLDWRRFEAGG